MSRCTIPFAELGRHDVATVGGKNSSLGEMIAKLAALGVTRARRLRHHRRRLPRVPRPRGPRRAHPAPNSTTLDVDDVAALAATGARIRELDPRRRRSRAALEPEIVAGYVAMCDGRGDVAVAVRSSATAEDLPEASFAGQQETLPQRPRRRDTC